MTHDDRRPEVAVRSTALEGRTARAIALRGSLRSHLRTTVKVNESWYNRRAIVRLRTNPALTVCRERRSPPNPGEAHSDLVGNERMGQGRRSPVPVHGNEVTALVWAWAPYSRDRSYSLSASAVPKQTLYKRERVACGPHQFDFTAEMARRSE